MAEVSWWDALEVCLLLHRSLPLHLKAQALHDNTVMSACSRKSKGVQRTHLFCCGACSCDMSAGVRHYDEHAPSPGSLAFCSVLALLDRCLGTCTSVNNLPRCRTRTHREAMQWHASSRHKSTVPGCKTRTLNTAPLYHPYPQQIPYSGAQHSTCDLSYAPLVIGR